MSELIKRLSGSCYLAFEDGTNDYSAAQEAIDRIEGLVKERDENDALAGKYMDLTDVLRAKLAKAVAGLRKIADHKHFIEHQGWTQNAEARIASAVLAELEGKK